MPIIERLQVQPVIKSDELNKKLRHHHERAFGSLLLQNNKIEIKPEPVKFVYVNGTEQYHLPDYGIKNLRTQKTSYIELTTSPLVEFELPIEEVEFEEAPMGTYEPRGVRIDNAGQRWVKFVSDPKARDRNIVKKVENEMGISIPYYVLYKQQLMVIQKRHPELDFFLDSEFCSK